MLQAFDELLQDRLQARAGAGLLRKLPLAAGRIDFCSNDYLGLSRASTVKDIALLSYPCGATGSRLITGNSGLAEKTESMIAAFHRAEAALIFSNGYMANLGLFSCIAGRGDTIIADACIHASVTDGVRLSPARRLKFKHNDLADLEKKLQQAAGRKFVAVESLYSMDGGEAPLRAIAALCQEQGALLIVDEAHATGLYGESGEGLVGHYGLEEAVYARVYTFGKAIGLHGAAVTGSSVLRNWLINYARPFIYTTAPPPPLWLQLKESYRLLEIADRRGLFERVDYFRERAAALGNIALIDSRSPIQALMMGDPLKTSRLAGHLFDKGFFVKAILSPTVAAGTERLRICLHSFNTREQINELLTEITKLI